MPVLWLHRASSCAQALAICRRYGISLPPAALAGLESGAFETPKPDDVIFNGYEVRRLATPQQGAEADFYQRQRLSRAAHHLRPLGLPSGAR